MIAEITEIAATGGATATGVFAAFVALWRMGVFNGNGSKLTPDDIAKAKEEGAREASQVTWQSATTTSLHNLEEGSGAQLKVLHSIKSGIDKLNEKGE